MPRWQNSAEDPASGKAGWAAAETIQAFWRRKQQPGPPKPAGRDLERMGDQALEDHFQHLLERGLEGRDTEESSPVRPTAATGSWGGWGAFGKPCCFFLGPTQLALSPRVLNLEPSNEIPAPTPLTFINSFPDPLV